MLPPGNRSAYVGTARIEDLDTAGAVLLSARIRAPRRRCSTAASARPGSPGGEVGMVGEAVDLTYPLHHLGDTPRRWGQGARGIVETDEGRGDPVIVIGQGALARPDGAAILGHVMALAEETGAKLLVLHTAAARVGAMDVGFTHEGGWDGALEGAEVVYNLGADERDIPEGPFVIYHGHHGDRGAHRRT